MQWIWNEELKHVSSLNELLGLYLQRETLSFCRVISDWQLKMNPNVPPPEADNTVDHANLCAALMTAVMLGDKKKAKSLIKQGMLIRKSS